MKLINLLILSLLIVSCGQEDEVSDTDLQNSVEAAVTALGGASDDQSGESQVYYQSSPYQKVLNFIQPIAPAYASASCGGRAALASCNTGVKEATYNSCSIGTRFTLDGNVSLTYSDSGCGMTTAGDEVNREFNLTLTGPFGSVNTTSERHNDYRGNLIGGGGKLVYEGGSDYTLSILGKRKTRTRANGSSGFDISIRTTSDISIEGGLRRASRVIDGGAIEIIHNKREYVATLEPTNLTYSSTCCYPVGGSIDITYSGSLEGSGTVSFNSCGSATVTYNGEPREIEFYSCE